MNTNSLIKEAKSRILASDINWSVRDEESDNINMVYTKPKEDASCGTACCIGCFAWPFAIIYAILGGKKGYNGQITIYLENEELIIDGDIQLVVNVYELLKYSHIGEYIVETHEIKVEKDEMKVKKGLFIGLIVLLVFLFIVSL